MRGHLFNGNFTQEGPNNMYEQALYSDYVKGQVLPALAPEECAQLRSYMRERQSAQTPVDQGNSACCTCRVALPLGQLEVSAEVPQPDGSHAIADIPLDPTFAAHWTGQGEAEDEFFQQCWDDTEELLARLREGEEVVAFDAPVGPGALVHHIDPRVTFFTLTVLAAYTVEPSAEASETLCLACAFSSASLHLLKTHNFKEVARIAKVRALQCSDGLSLHLHRSATTQQQHRYMPENRRETWKGTQTWQLTRQL